jgi:type I restriction enzyme S subunit
MERLYEVDSNDLIVNITFAWEGAIAIVRPEDSGALVSHRFPTYQFDQNAVLPEFFRYPILNKQFIYNLGVISPGGAGRNRVLNKADFLKIELALPEVAEQQKIADCLGSLDDLIATEGRKLEALRQHKQGLMQQLFPQPGESRPRLRFPEFRNAVEWQRCALGEIAEISKGKGISKSDVVEGGRTPCVRYGELYNSYGEIIEIVKSRTNLPASDLVLSNAGDVIIPASGETKEDIATCACVVDDGVALGSDLNVIRSPVDGRFLSYYLNGSRRRELAKVAQGDTVAHLYPTQLSRLEVYIPDAKAEQQRIADCLSSLDARLAVQVQKQNALETHKQGLLQQLFPSLEG